MVGRVMVGFAGQLEELRVEKAAIVERTAIVEKTADQRWRPSHALLFFLVLFVLVVSGSLIT